MDKKLFLLRLWVICFFFFFAPLEAIEKGTHSSQAPDNFVFLSDVDPTIIENRRYVGIQNFLGRPVKGYESSRIILTREAALALKKAHDDLKKNGISTGCL